MVYPALTSSISPVEGVQEPHNDKQPRRMLDLFGGTGSVGAVYREAGFQVVSLDMDEKWKADIQVDVLEWDYKVYPRGIFILLCAGFPAQNIAGPSLQGPAT